MTSARTTSQIKGVVVIKEEPSDIQDDLDDAVSTEVASIAKNAPVTKDVSPVEHLLNNKGQAYTSKILAVESVDVHHADIAVKPEAMVVEVPPDVVQGILANGLQDRLASPCSSSSSQVNSTITEKTLNCPYCNHRAICHSQLLLHLRRHTGERPFGCDSCDYRAARLSLLRAHMKTHTSESYSCDKCEYRTGNFNKLLIHKSSHSDDTPYACDSCDYRTRFLNHLEPHMRTHTGEKPYACEICDYKARQLGTLKVHMRKHTGEKPYFCHSCDYQTAHPSALRRHMKAHK